MVRRSFFLSFADKATGLVLALTTMAIVSRLMTPAQIGLFLVASSLVILVEALRDFGIASFLIQDRDLTPEVTRCAATLIGLMSLGLGAVVVLGAGLASAVYEMPELGRLIRIAALAFLLAPISSPLLALMKRDMNFGAVTRIGISAAAVNAGVTIGLALAGFGPVSFAWGAVMAAATTAAGAVFCRPEWWIFRPTLRHWRRILPFGAWTTVVTLLGMLFDATPRLILGRVLGFDAVGLLSRAVSLTQLPERVILGAVPPVVLPALSQRVRARLPIDTPYLLGMSLITAIQWPALVCLALLSDPIVRLLLGPQWLEVIPLVRITALAAMLLAPIYLTFPVLVSVGRMREMALVSLVALPVSMAAVLIASRFGLTAVAWSLFPANAAYVLPLLVLVQRHVGFRWGELAGVALRSAVVTSCAGMIPAAVLLAQGTGPGLAGTALAAAGAVAGWGAGLALSGHPLGAEIARLGGAARVGAAIRPRPAARRYQ
ncbi:Lipopolysaccharide biosynthesis protein WzxC (plasmid) [Paracoccaceae bacterium]|nr:Lipopolysaccharide biosynthesis protein WzxC [Paracoccaceae bacterium]